MAIQQVNVNVNKLNERKLRKKKFTILFMNQPISKWRRYLVNWVVFLFNRVSPLSIGVQYD